MVLGARSKKNRKIGQIRNNKKVRDAKYEIIAHPGQTIIAKPYES